MKFVCPSCKAKYQIADERVTGRSAKMKCRKCGTVIRISEHGVELADKRSVAPPAAGTTASSTSARGGAGVSVPPAGTHSPAVPRAGVALGSSPLATPRPVGAPRTGGLGQHSLSTPSRPHAARPGASGGAPLPPPPSAPIRPPVAAPHPPARAPAPPRRSAPTATESEEAAHALDGASGREDPRPLTSAPQPDVGDPVPAASDFFDGESGFDGDDDEQTRVAPGLDELGLGGLAGAFHQAVAAPAASALEALNMPADDWYVGINGVPAGPMRLNELRSKASSGAVDGESLVWRDGFEDWRPLKSFPELLAIIEDVLPSPSQVAASAGVAPVGQVSDPFAAPSGGVSPTAELDLEAAGIPRRAGPSPAAWLAIVAAMGLGFTVSYVLFSNPEKEVQRVPAQSPEQVVAPADSGKASKQSSEAAVEETVIEEQRRKAGSERGGGGTIPAKTNAAGPTEKKEGGLKGLAGLKEISGPTGPSGEAAPARAGQPLDSAQVQRTVSRYTASVKRSCWQPALDTRDKDAPSSARVTVTIKVSPSGSVQGVSTSGDPSGYRGLSNCIAARVRGWQFPASSGTTTVNVPFVFAAQ